MPSSAPNPLPVGLVLAARSAIRAIDSGEDGREQALCSAFLNAAWPSLRAQNQ